MLRTVKLYGLAAQTYGKEFRLDVSSLAEAVRALSCQFPDFVEFIKKHNFHVRWGNKFKKAQQLGEEEVKLLLNDSETIHIMPLTQGHKKGGLMKVIAGVFLLATAFFVPMALGVPMSTGIGLGGLTYGNLAVLGLGMIAAGVTQMLTKKPKNDDKKDDSFMLDGQLNVTEQGGPVPLIYGRTMVGSVLISAGLSTVDIAVPSHSSGGKF
ncbi:tail assembly protein I [Rhizobium phage RHph_I4]|nr:tail assembly protein I [Rhizobium phage RHph_I4]